MRSVMLLAGLMLLTIEARAYEPWPQIEDDGFRDSEEYGRLKENFELYSDAYSDSYQNPFKDAYVHLPDKEFADNRTKPLQATIYGPRQQAGPHPAVLYFGPWTKGIDSSYEDAGKYWSKPVFLRELVAGLNARGILFIRIEYLSGEYPQTWQCGLAALRWLKSHAVELNLDASRLGAMGYDQGGHLAALLALALPEREDCAAIRALCAGGTPWDLADIGNRYSEVHPRQAEGRDVTDVFLRRIVGPLPDEPRAIAPSWVI